MDVGAKTAALVARYLTPMFTLAIFGRERGNEFFRIRAFQFHAADLFRARKTRHGLVSYFAHSS